MKYLLLLIGLTACSFEFKPSYKYKDEISFSKIDTEKVVDQLIFYRCKEPAMIIAYANEVDEYKIRVDCLHHFRTVFTKLKENK